MCYINLTYNKIDFTLRSENIKLSPKISFRVVMLFSLRTLDLGVPPELNLA